MIIETIFLNYSSNHPLNQPPMQQETVASKLHLDIRVISKTVHSFKSITLEHSRHFSIDSWYRYKLIKMFILRPQILISGR